jgi:probable HAF family extracellular repeat protein
MRTLSRAGALLAALGCCSDAAAVTPPLPSYTLTLIAVPANASSVQANALNGGGQVTGAIEFPSQPSHAFLYSQGVMTDLGTLSYPGTSLMGDASGQAINAAGVVAGTFAAPLTQLWSLGFSGPSAGLTALFGLTGFSNCTATGINTAGLIVGGCSGSAGSPSAVAVLYSNGTPTPIGPAGGSASAVNDYAQVAAVSSTSGFLYANGVVTGIPPLASTSSPAPAASPTAINNAGEVVGWQAVSAGFTGFLYLNGATQALPSVPVSSVLPTASLNNAGQVVGYTVMNSVTTPFFIANGTTSNLNALISATDPNRPFVTLTRAVAINDKGWILANGLDSRTSVSGAYLLTPTTLLPVTVTVLAAATAVVNTAFTVAWTDQSAASCTASGGSGSDGWKGSLATNGGQLAVTESASGTYNFTLDCAGTAGSVSSTAKVVVSGKTSGGGGLGGGGGGSLELVTLAALLALGASGVWSDRRRCGDLPH